MAFWFAPGLVAVGGFQSIAAFKLSFKGCLRNILPFLVYGLAGLAVIFVFSMVIGLLAASLAFFMEGQGSVIVIIAISVIYLVIGIPAVTVSGLSIYTSFRDIFFEPSSS
jgi:hypothetical protein